MIKLSKIFLYLFVMNCCSNNINQLDENGLAPLHYAVMGGDVEKVRNLIKEGADVNLQSKIIDKYYPLHLAISRKHFDVAKVLVENHANINSLSFFGGTPLMLASWFEQEEIVNYLLGKGADINAQDNNGHSAVYTNSLKILNILLKNGAKIDIVDAKGISPKENFNRYFGDTILWEVITAKDIKEKTNLRNERQETSLHLAILYKSSWLAGVLIDAGACVNARDKDGETPLHYAVYYLHDLGIVKKLVEKGADVNARNKDGEPPIFGSIYDERNISIIEYLVQKGANVNLKDNRSETVLDSKIKILKIKEILIKAGAKSGKEIK